MAALFEDVMEVESVTQVKTHPRHKLVRLKSHRDAMTGFDRPFSYMELWVNKDVEVMPGDTYDFRA